jgi:hypothetical protein
MARQKWWFPKKPTEESLDSLQKIQLEFPQKQSPLRSPERIQFEWLRLRSNGHKLWLNLINCQWFQSSLPFSWRQMSTGNSRELINTFSIKSEPRANQWIGASSNLNPGPRGPLGRCHNSYYNAALIRRIKGVLWVLSPLWWRFKSRPLHLLEINR